LDKNIIIIDAGAVAHMQYIECESVGSLVEIRISENAQLMYRVHNIQAGDVRITFQLERNAILDCQLLFVAPEGNVILEVVMNGEGACATVKGLYLLSGKGALRLETKQHHYAPHTTSNLVVKGIVCGEAKAEYYGTTRIEKAARESVSSQENKNILLSEAARVVSVPNLEVLTNDVRCFHGSAIARCDEEHLLYAASRGMSEAQAQRLVLQAFVADVCKNEMMREAVLNYIEKVV